ncbi:MAG TPA: DPP IV N-terminal domain-containing protein [Acidimicrobiales bacterium]|nr:DPP IV N-terminal domain-containing protein [Acidimicrobiales bacterium]
MDVGDVARYPLPGTVVPGSIAFAPGGGDLTWLQSPAGDLARELQAVDLSTGEVRVLAGGGAGEDDLSLEEKLRRERTRQLAVGVTSYAWADDAEVLLVPLPDGLHVGPPGALRLVLAAGSPPIDPRLSPDGTRVAFVRDGDLWCAPPERRLTFAADEGRTAGLADFVAQEEMDQPHGFWWSPDGARLAFLDVDESAIVVTRLPHADGTHEDHRYPFAGGVNPTVRLGVVDAATGEVSSVDLGVDYEYLARVDWLDATTLAVQVEDRRQTRLDVVRVDVATGGAAVLHTETSPVWINLHHALRPADGGAAFVWMSERTGFAHLEVRSSADGSLLRTLTDGDWAVTSVAGVGAGHVWFVATLDSPLERHLYAVPLAGGDVRRVTVEPGTHDVVVDAERGRFVDTWSALDRPPTVRLCDLADGSVLRVLHDERDPRIDELGLRPPELATVVADDGETVLHAALYRPDGDGPHRTVLSVYGGPHVQRVTDSWAPTVRMRDQYLRSLGYLVVAVDNRGSAGRGLAFEGAVRHDLGEVEVRDQVAALRQLAGRGLVDLAGGVGVHGWSYGGYLSAMCLAKAPDVFSAAVAGAPVTAWDGYDTHYTERYMGLPSENPDGYRRSAVMAHVAGMRDRQLLLVHGMIDENVHFRHTARLVNALIAERVPYGLLLFPDERHLPRREADRVYMEERIAAFLTSALPPA